MVEQERLTTSQKNAARNENRKEVYKMKKTIEEMLDEIIFNFGFEDRITLRFCKVLKTNDIEKITEEYNKIMSKLRKDY